MNLQLADGSLETPMGLLENVLVKCIEFEHTFDVVDFGQERNYKVILGRTFMRQFLMIQDWGYNYPPTTCTSGMKESSQGSILKLTPIGMSLTLL